MSPTTHLLNFVIMHVFLSQLNRLLLFYNCYLSKSNISKHMPFFLVIPFIIIMIIFLVIDTHISMHNVSSIFTFRCIVKTRMMSQREIKFHKNDLTFSLEPIVKHVNHFNILKHYRRANLNIL